MQLVIRNDLIDDNSLEESRSSSRHPPPPPPPPPPRPPSRPVPPPPGSIPPLPPPPPPTRHPRVRPGFMQLVFKDSILGEHQSAAPVLKQRRKTNRVRPPQTNGFQQEAESVLKPWQRHFKKVFEKMGLKPKPSRPPPPHSPVTSPPPRRPPPRPLSPPSPVQGGSPFPNFPNFQRQEIGQRPSLPSPPPPPPTPSRQTLAPNPFADSTSIPWPPFDPVPKKRKKGKKKAVPFLPLGLVPPSHPLQKVLPVSARVLGVKKQASQSPHVMSLETFLKEFPDMGRVRPVPIEVEGGESDVISQLASGEEADDGLFDELDDLIARRKPRTFGKKVQPHGL